MQGKFRHEVTLEWLWDSSIPVSDEEACFEPIIEDLEKECGATAHVEGWDIEGACASILVLTNERAATRAACERVALHWKLPGATVS